MAKTPVKSSVDPASLVESHRAAVNANPHDAAAQTALGWALYGAKRYAEAAEAFQRALTIDMNFIDAHYGFGLASKALGQKEPAVAAFDKVAALAAQLEDHVRGAMLRRLAHGHINEMGTGNWNLAQEIWTRAA